MEINKTRQALTHESDDITAYSGGDLGSRHVRHSLARPLARRRQQSYGVEQDITELRQDMESNIELDDEPSVLGNSTPDKLAPENPTVEVPVAKQPVPVVEKRAEQGDQDCGITREKEAPRSPVRGKLPASPRSPTQSRTQGDRHVSAQSVSNSAGVSEWSHQQLAPPKDDGDTNAMFKDDEDEWQEMPAYAPFDIYDDDGKLIAREAPEESGVAPEYSNLGGAAKGYTRVQVDEDAQSATSMDENTAYLFKEAGTEVIDEDEEIRDPLAQMEATKDLLTENQRIAYVGVVRLAMADMTREIESMERTRSAKKMIDLALEGMKMWSQKMMVRLYGHMELSPQEQIMIEQLADHGLQPSDLTPTLMQDSRVKNPMKSEARSSTDDKKSPDTVPPSDSESKHIEGASAKVLESSQDPNHEALPPPPYSANDPVTTTADVSAVTAPIDLPSTAQLDIDLRWTVLCDLFLILVVDSVYDARSRALLERVGTFLSVPWLDICRFEKRVTDALEMQESANKEDWDEKTHMEDRKKRARNRRLVMMGLATVGGGLVIGLSAGLLAPVIGAGLAAGFTTIGVSGTSTFLAGAGGAAVIGTGGVLTGGTIGGRAAGRRTGAVKTFEYRPLHNNKRVNLVVTVAGWMNGKVDDVRLPFSTVDPIMGDIYSVLWEPEMLTSMGDTINILATEALTQGLQQILGSTILIGLMAALQLPIVLTKLSYLIDNPWSVSLARADMAGLILADSLTDRNLGARPITLVGFSLGSRVIFSCLRELAKKGALGLVQNVYIFGSPVVVKKDEYLAVRTVVSGRFVNGYASNDWILGYLFRATSGGIMRVAGLAKVEIPGVENIDVTEHVPGHMSYRKAMPKILKDVGWAVESEEFTEIEDPDPENHGKRQRELINEIEEARKELQKKPEKKRFGLFRSSKKMAEKKEWEMYDERLKEGVAPGDDEATTSAVAASNVMFDVDAIQKEVAELAAKGIEIRELKTTQPPMRLGTASDAGSNTSLTDGSRMSNGGAARAYSYDEGSSTLTNGATTTRRRGTSLYNEHEEGTFMGSPGDEVTMTFEMPHSSTISPPRPQLPPKDFPSRSPSRSPLPRGSHSIYREASPLAKDAYSDAPQLHNNTHEHGDRGFGAEYGVTEMTTTSNQPPHHHRQAQEDWGVAAPPPPAPAAVAIGRNVWADEEEEFGREKELELTFE